MEEIRVSFCIEGKKYQLFVERKLFLFEVYLFQELKDGFLKPVKVQASSASIIVDSIRYWLMKRRLKVSQKVEKKGGKLELASIRKELQAIRNLLESDKADVESVSRQIQGQIRELISE